MDYNVEPLENPKLKAKRIKAMPIVYNEPTFPGRSKYSFYDLKKAWLEYVMEDDKHHRARWKKFARYVDIRDGLEFGTTEKLYVRGQIL